MYQKMHLEDPDGMCWRTRGSVCRSVSPRRNMRLKPEDFIDLEGLAYGIVPENGPNDLSNGSMNM